MRTCNEPGCEEKFDDINEFTVHSSYHDYFQKIKNDGLKQLEQLQTKFNTTIKCPIADSLDGFYYFPQLPLNLRCRWYECRAEFLCVEDYYNHVSDHAHRFVDKCYWENCNKSMKKITLQLIREHLRVHTLQKLFACPYCGNFFSTKIKFDDHFLRHLPMPEILTNTTVTPKIVNKKLGDLKFDLEEYQTAGARIQLYRCKHDNCNKSFLTSSLLREHIREHSKKYQCEKCSYVAKTSSGLESHILYRHRNDRNYECKICLKTFKQRGDLRVHVRRHQIVEPFKCDKCDFQTLNEVGLATHAKLHDKTNDYCCHLCLRLFTRGNNLTRHLKSKHKLSVPEGKSRFKFRLADQGVYVLDTDDIDDTVE